MVEVLGIRPFVPAKDHGLSVRFYESLGFAVTYRDSSIALLALGGFSFILQNFFDAASAANCMVQLLVPDVDAAWTALTRTDLVAAFGVKAPIPPSVQHWGLKVGFLFDPAGVLWHVAEPPR